MSGTLSQGPGGGIVPPGAAPVAGPMLNNMVARFGNMSTEQLQEYAARLGGSPQGQIAQRALQQRHFMPQPQGQSSGIAQTPQATAAGVTMPPTTNAMRRGGGIQPAHRDMGGGLSSSQEDPWWVRSEARDSGMIHAYSPGRTDTVNMEPLAGSYVIPADVISGLGEGNTLAGAAVADRMFGTGPHGIPMPRGDHGRGPPAPPRIVNKQFQAKGGTSEGAPGNRVPVVVAGGEYMVSPEQVRAIGGGDIKRGHDILDAFVLEQRRRTVNDLKKLPPPKKK